MSNTPPDQPTSGLGFAGLTRRLRGALARTCAVAVVRLRQFRLRAPAPVIAAIGVVLIVLLAGPLDGDRLLLACVTLGAVALVAGASERKQPEVPSDPLLIQSVADRLERRIEQLNDMSWELREKEARYRDLLNAQSDAICCRDDQGHLTFVNRAFCQVFDLEVGKAIGTRFDPVVILEDVGKTPNTARDGMRRARTQRVMTVQGPRWMRFDDLVVPGADGFGREVQTVGRDITEQRAFEAELALARDQAQSADRAKSRFLAAMSHEIRTPMNGILGMGGLLLETKLTGDQQTFVRAIDQSAKTLLALIDEILDFSKIEAGKLHLDVAPFSLATALQNVVELLAPRAHEKGLEIAWTLDPDTPARLVGDETRLKQILLNLIGNAVKFTDRGGVLLGASVQPAPDGQWRVSLAIKDTGIGLSTDAIDKLFAEFGQVEMPMAQRRGGTGLGLVISKRLARAMGGDIRVESKLGRGATFTAEVVLRAVEGEPSRPTVVCRTGDGERPLTVLLAFDRMIERRALAATLASLGARALEASADPQSDIAAASGAGMPVGVVIVDVQEDVREAARILAEARAAGGPSVKGIVLLDALARGSLRNFREGGFDSFLVRPVRLQAVIAQTGLGRDGLALQQGEGFATGADQRDGGQAEALRGLNILLAEDNPINALLTRRMLESSGAVCTHVVDGEAAVEAVDRVEAAFDLVLMDVHMPKVDGLEATRRIRSLAKAGAKGAQRRLPIVALTANAFVEDRQRCLEAGCDDYLAKPFQRSELEAVLARWSRNGWPGQATSQAAGWSRSCT